MGGLLFILCSLGGVYWFILCCLGGVLVYQVCSRSTYCYFCDDLLVTGDQIHFWCTGFGAVYWLAVVVILAHIVVAVYCLMAIYWPVLMWRCTGWWCCFNGVLTGIDMSVYEYRRTDWGYCHGCTSADYFSVMVLGV